MPDLLAGTTLLAQDTPPTVSDEQAGSFTFNATTFGTDNDSGTYVDCGVAFVACTTGRALIHYAAQLSNSGGATLVSPAVRTGSTVGAGTTVVASSDDEQINNRDTDQRRYGASLLVSGLTAGAAYNVLLEHRVTAGTGTIARRSVVVGPAT